MLTTHYWGDCHGYHGFSCKIIFAVSSQHGKSRKLLLFLSFSNQHLVNQSRSGGIEMLRTLRAFLHMWKVGSACGGGERLVGNAEVDLGMNLR